MCVCEREFTPAIQVCIQITVYTPWSQVIGSDALSSNDIKADQKDRQRELILVRTMNVSDALSPANEEGTSASMTSPTFGYIAIVVCAICFGTNYLPVKKFTMGDGKQNVSIRCAMSINSKFLLLIDVTLGSFEMRDSLPQ